MRTYIKFLRCKQLSCVKGLCRGNSSFEIAYIKGEFAESGIEGIGASLGLLHSSLQLVYKVDACAWSKRAGGLEARLERWLLLTRPNQGQWCRCITGGT